MRAAGAPMQAAQAPMQAHARPMRAHVRPCMATCLQHLGQHVVELELRVRQLGERRVLVLLAQGKVQVLHLVGGNTIGD